MKKIIFILAFFVVSFEGMSIGRPHNVFATHQIVSMKFNGGQSLKKTPSKPITTAIDNAKEAMNKTKNTTPLTIARWVSYLVRGRK